MKAAPAPIRFDEQLAITQFFIPGKTSVEYVLKSSIWKANIDEVEDECILQGA